MNDAATALPADWRTAPLKSVATVRFSSVDKKTTPRQQVVRLCNYIDVYTREYIRGNEPFMVATASDSEISQFGVRCGDVLMTKDSETPDDIGVPSVLLCDPESLVCGYHLALLRPDRQQVDPVFLAKQLRHHRLARYFGQMCNGLTRYGLPTAAVENAVLWLPSDVSEQTAIGSLLRKVDEAIRETAAVIEKLKKIKAGLLHDLLTRGIDEDGELRDPIRHPEHFKESPLGKVPKAWDVLKVRDMLARYGGHVQTGPFGSQLHASEYAVSGVPVVMPQDIRADGEISLDSVARITTSRAKDLSRHFLQLNDLVFARRGDLSRCSPIHVRAAGWICGTGCLLMRPPAKVIRADWFAALYRHDFCQRQIAARAVGSMMVNLNTGLILDLLIPHPHPEEQARIEARLRQHDNRMQAEGATLRKLTLMKQGLMQDLLTGRVRVNVGSAAGKTAGKVAAT